MHNLTSINLYFATTLCYFCPDFKAIGEVENVYKGITQPVARMGGFQNP